MRDTLNITPTSDDTSESCLAVRLSQYAELSQGEASFVAEMERDVRRVSQGQTLISAGSQLSEIFVLSEGWAVVLSRPRREEAQILRVHLPGEVIGWAEIGSPNVQHSVRMITDGVICPFPRAGLADLYGDLPRLAALFTAIVSLDHIALRDHLAMLGLAPAKERLAHFLSDLLYRLRVGSPGMTEFDLPLRQSDIAAALGITPVYVSKLMRDLCDAGLIEVDRPRLRIPDPARLAQLGRYTQSPRKVDLSWLDPLDPAPVGAI